jgi:hypothetical protein
MTHLTDSGTLASIASIIAGFSVAMLYFRIQRELDMGQKGERNWIPWSDWLLIAAIMLSLLLGIIPLLAMRMSSKAYLILPSSSCAGASILVAGYPLAILAHYRFILGGSRKGPRYNPEPAERWIVLATFATSLAVFAWVTWTRLAG